MVQNGCTKNNIIKKTNSFINDIFQGFFLSKPSQTDNLNKKGQLLNGFFSDLLIEVSS